MMSEIKTRRDIKVYAELQRLYISGMSLRGLAAKFGVTHQCISGKLRKCGTEMRTSAASKGTVRKSRLVLIPIGSKFGRLTIVGPPEYKARDPFYPVRCECGTQKKVMHYSLKNGDTRSCGCLRKDIRKAEREELRRLYESGLSLRQIAKIKGVTFATINQRLHRAGTAMRSRGTRT
jgi:transposase